MTEETLTILMRCINSDDGLWVNDCFKGDEDILQERYQVAIYEGLIELSGNYLVATDKGYMINDFFKRPIRHLARDLNQARSAQNQRMNKAENQAEASVAEGQIYMASYALNSLARNKDNHSKFE